jgi:pentalenene oxygenase
MAALAAQRRQDGTDHGDLLSTLLQPDQVGHRLSDTEVTDQLVTFLMAGVETTAQAVAWAWYEISRHPRIEVQLHAEADTVLAGRPVRYADLTQLELTRRIVTETLRLHSPAWLLTRHTTEDTDLGGHRIPAGTDVLCSPYLSAHQPQTFADPEHFDPGRWEPARAAVIARNAFIPFGSGPRKCIGDTLATMEVTLNLGNHRRPLAPGCPARYPGTHRSCGYLDPAWPAPTRPSPLEHVNFCLGMSRWLSLPLAV